ncbi:MAG: DUF898 domain-containing protein [Bacteroidetes bacterium]|nr:DUF898 domain-containing protein [Bacteroidota bacterium]
MKTYFDFTLQPKKFLNIWLLFYVLVLIPYGWYSYRVSTGTLDMDHPGRILLVMFLVFLFALGIYFYFTRIFVEHIRFGEKKLEFSSSFSSYLNTTLPGFLLSILSMTIYLAWFVRDILKFFAGSSRLDGEAFQFHGSAGRLFVIVVLSLYLPIIVLTMLTVQLPLQLIESPWFFIINQALTMIVLVPYMYLAWVWIINFQHRDQHIYLNTRFTESGPIILRELGLTIITLGIYFPVMYLRLYAHFAERTIVVKEGSYKTFGYDLEVNDDFVFIWGQTLICIVTLGIYAPWALCKVGKRVLSKTYLTESMPIE